MPFSSAKRRVRFRRRIRGGSRGVVSVVGTLLALLVFFALFGIFLTQYVPLWMSEDEEALTVQVQTSFADLKSGIDGQVVAGGPAVVATPMTLASQSIPLLSQPTTATIAFTPPQAGGPYAAYTLAPAPGSTNSKIPFPLNLTVGSLRVSIPARYYSPETMTLEDDAIVQTQLSSQQVVEFPPSLSANVSGNGFGVTAVLVVVTGVSAAATGAATEELFTHYVFTQTYYAQSASAYENASFVEGTSYPCAWYNFTVAALSGASAPAGFSGHYTVSAPPASACSGHPTSLFPFKVAYTDLASFKLIYAEVRLVLGVGTE